MLAIKVKGLSRTFGKVAAVEDLDLEIEEGEVLGFLGPNGAGKTTTIRLLAGMIAPTAGYAEIYNLRTDRDVARLHEIIGLLTESPGFYDRFSALKNLEFFSGFYTLANPSAQIEKYLRLMGLWERRQDKVGAYSKGMKHRLALARALIHEPKVLFLDEPTSGLDPAAAKEVRDLIKDLSEQGRTVFLSTHNLMEAESLCNRIAVFRSKLLAIDTTENLHHRFSSHHEVVQLENADDRITEAVRRFPFVLHLEKDGDKLVIELKEPEHDRPELVKLIIDAGGRILSVTGQQHTLEDIYLNLVREDTHDK